MRVKSGPADLNGQASSQRKATTISESEELLVPPLPLNQQTVYALL